MTEKMTFVTVTAIDAGGNCQSATEYFNSEYDVLDEIVKSATEAATEWFRDDFETEPMRCIVQVFTVPTPRVPVTRLPDLDVPDQTAETVVVKTEIS